MSAMRRTAPREGWILAGTVDGQAARPALLDDLGGIPYLTRLVLDLALAGATRIYLLWELARPLPDLSAVFADPRIASRVSIEIAARAPSGSEGDGIVIVRADRIMHREMSRAVAEAWTAGEARIAKIAGDAHDGVYAADRAIARDLAEAASQPGGIAGVIARHEVALAPPPYLAFTAAAPDRRSLLRAERQLVWSLRKSADGIAAKWINRHISLPISWMLARTPIHPNHITGIALVLALIGGLVISRGGYLAGLAGMLLVNFGSIVDGVDGELARLRFQFSRVGQWLDTVADDLANLAYAGGVMANLHAAGVTWALPLGLAAAGAFICTQSTQYLLIRFVYGSGDLAAIPWAFQSSQVLSGTGLRAFLPRLFKRDFVVTTMVVFAALGRLEWILVTFATGAFVFFVVFFVQFARNIGSIRRARR